MLFLCAVKVNMNNIILNFILDDDLINMNLVGNIINDLARPLPLLIIEQRQIKLRNEDYFEEIVPNYNDTQFFEHFRMPRGSAEVSLRLFPGLF